MAVTGSCLPPTSPHAGWTFRRLNTLFITSCRITRRLFLHRNGRTARMHATGTSYLLLTPDEQPAYLKVMPEAEKLSDNPVVPKPSPWTTLYIAAGKKDKVNKVDIVGLLLKKGQLEKEDLGLIEVLDHSSYAAVKRSRIERTVQLIKN